MVGTMPGGRVATETVEITYTVRAIELKSTFSGLVRPTLEVNWPGCRLREMSALLHGLAAAVELATPDHRKWPVQIDHSEEHGAVYCEMVDGGDDEIYSAVSVLRGVVDAYLSKRLGGKP